MTVSDAVLGDRIARWRQKRHLSQTQLASLIVGLDQSKLSRVESGARRVSSSELADLSEALHVDPLDLLEDEPLSEGLITAARGGLLESAVDEEALGLAGGILRTWRSVVRDGFPPKLGTRPELPSLPRGDVPAGKAAARIIRSALDLGSGPLGELMPIASQLGLVVAYKGFDEGFDGVCVADNNHAVAVINSNTWGARQRFTLAHEIGHWIFGDVDVSPRLDRNVFEATDGAERRANAFAADLLVPDDALVELKAASRTSATSFAYEYGVSLTTLGWRIHNDLPQQRKLAEELQRALPWEAADEAGAMAGYQANSDARNRRGVTFEFEVAIRTAELEGALSDRHVSSIVGDLVVANEPGI